MIGEQSMTPFEKIKAAEPFRTGLDLGQRGPHAEF
jgi:hypothetical protein